MQLVTPSGAPSRKVLASAYANARRHAFRADSRRCDNRRPSSHASARPPPLDHPTVLVALVLGIVEGLTEFLPISSTGHLIVAGSLLGYTGERAKVFEIVIQAGAILAVCWEYRARLSRVARGLAERSATRSASSSTCCRLPAGRGARAAVRARSSSATCSRRCRSRCAFIVGAFVILWAERRQRVAPSTVRIDRVDAMRWTDALKVGFAQALALIPGTSRSGATIIGGMLFGLSRAGRDRVLVLPRDPDAVRRLRLRARTQPRAAVDAATCRCSRVGFVAAFVSAFLCVRWLIRYVSRTTSCRSRGTGSRSGC